MYLFFYCLGHVVSCNVYDNLDLKNVLICFIFGWLSQDVFKSMFNLYFFQFDSICYFLMLLTECIVLWFNIQYLEKKLEKTSVICEQELTFLLQIQSTWTHLWSTWPMGTGSPMWIQIRNRPLKTSRMPSPWQQEILACCQG